MPILRVRDAALTRQFCVDWLGFGIDFEYQFERGLPLFIGVSRNGTALGLGEHHGDGTTGSAVWAPRRDLTSTGTHRWWPRRLTTSHNRRRRPSGPTMTVVDPFDNELRFCEPPDRTSARWGHQINWPLTRSGGRGRRHVAFAHRDLNARTQVSLVAWYGLLRQGYWIGPSELSQDRLGRCLMRDRLELGEEY